MGLPADSGPIRCTQDTVDRNAWRWVALERHHRRMISHATARRLVIVGFWMLFGVISAFQIQISMLSHHHSWARVITCQVLVWGVWIPFTLAIVWLVHRVPLAPPRVGALLLHLAMAVGFAFIHTTLWVSAEFLLVPYDSMNPTDFAHRFRSITIYQMPLELVLYGLVVLAHYADRAAQLERERDRRAAQLEASLAQARLTALELQTQPHFLFNTLNGIGALVRAGQNPQALSMIAGLSDLLRYALERGGATVALEEEARTVGLYLEIQRIRFADRMTVDMAMAPETLHGAMPVLLLQPLAENAVRHGIARSGGAGQDHDSFGAGGGESGDRDLQHRTTRRHPPKRHRALDHGGASGRALRGPGTTRAFGIQWRSFGPSLAALS